MHGDGLVDTELLRVEDQEIELVQLVLVEQARASAEQEHGCQGRHSRCETSNDSGWSWISIAYHPALHSSDLQGSDTEACSF
jgi:hypothetical protein